MMDAERKEPGYDATYAAFDAPLMWRVRHASYATDIGQHSWLDADARMHDLAPLHLTRASHLLDLGCGPAGPLTYVVGLHGCRGTGIDVSARALESGRARVAALGLTEQVALLEGDLDQPVPLVGASFDAVMSWDAVLHVRDRGALFREVARLIAPEGRFLFTDAGIVIGAISSEEVSTRATHGFTQFVPPGFNERVLEEVWFRVLDRQDRTQDLIRNANGRLAARAAHRDELVRHEGREAFSQQERYLETVVRLAQRGAVSRMLYVTELTPRSE